MMEEPVTADVVFNACRGGRNGYKACRRHQKTAEDMEHCAKGPGVG